MCIQVVSDVGKMLRDGLAYGYLAAGDAELFHEVECVLVGAVGGAESRHGDPDDTCAVIAQQVGRCDGDKERPCRVESAGYTQHQRVGVGVLPSSGQAGRLNLQDVGAVTVRPVGAREERMLREVTMERLGALPEGGIVRGVLQRGHGHLAVRGGLVGGEIGIPLAVRAQSLHINLADYHAGASQEAFALVEHLAILGDIAAAGIDEVVRALSHAGRGIDIATMDTRGLLREHLAAEVMLADQTVTTTEVEDNLGPLDSQLGGRGHGTPEVLAYLDAEAVVARSKQQVSTERHFPTPQLDAHRRASLSGS